MEEILKELMNTKCVSMHNNQFRCYGKRCTGQCAQFQIALQKLHECAKYKDANTKNSLVN